MQVDLNLNKFIWQNLKDAGCDYKMINNFIILIHKGNKHIPCRLLTKQRYALLDTIHDNQKKLDCLDYFIRKMKKEGFTSNE